MLRATLVAGPSVDTPMAVASVSKSFTALAVMQLSEKGKIALDQPVRRYLLRPGREDHRTAVAQPDLRHGRLGLREKSLPQPVTLATQPGTAAGVTVVAARLWGAARLRRRRSVRVDALRLGRNDEPVAG
ncbi:serine hydrolase domain-containing protein [Nonomuraea sp. LP-02]|uniref:serine hydrolase domain-containing protein n=1 Tax=Nonomuraea sp. LP-02 TaxID=3097960 RepID=UPI002E358DAE|nr:serine hydrolase domain-containing protein [Nonomuraea sp. LP-02]MED7931560.1 serine hydrolase domain-containing protein [Nonomuraea sp. LP-02]